MILLINNILFTPFERVFARPIPCILKVTGVALLIFGTWYATLEANTPKKEYIVMHCRERAGMFSIFHDVLALVKCYEKELYKGVEVDFKKEGLYYSPEHGENWWSYYCEPIQLGLKENVRHVEGDPPGSISWEVEYHTSRHEANHFQNNHFDGHYVICVHYRGTDKITEAPAVPYFNHRNFRYSLLFA